MALSGLEIYKQLPKTNCKECGFPTCLAFAMKLAQKGTELSKCPYVTDETRAALDAAAAPPIRLVAIGVGDRAVAVGNETVLFRHERTFVHPPALMVHVADDAADLAEKAKLAGEYAVERVGIMLTLGGVVVENRSGDAAVFVKAVETVRAEAPGMPIVLMSADPTAVAAALGVVGAERPLIHAATASNWETFAALAKEHSCPLTIRAESIEGLAELSAQVTGAGAEDIVLAPSPTSLGSSLALFTQLRRLALKKNCRPLGYPIIAFTGAGSVAEEAIASAQAIAKYAGVIVLDHADPALFYTLEHLHRSAEAHPGGTQALLRRHSGAGQPAAHHDQLLAHLLQRVGRGRE